MLSTSTTPRASHGNTQCGDRPPARARDEIAVELPASLFADDDRQVPTRPRTRSTSSRRPGIERPEIRPGERPNLAAPTQDRQALTERGLDWSRELRPVGSVQRWFVEHAAALSYRLDKAVERENVAIEENVAAAEREWLTRRRAWARRLGHKLNIRPTSAHAGLLGSAFGCDWLADRLEVLADELERPGVRFGRDTFERTARLLGVDPERPLGDHPILFPPRSNLRFSPAPANDPHRHDLSPRIAALRAEVARLRTLRQRLWIERDRPELEAACLRARTLDLGPEGLPARRFESALALELQRTLAGLARLRREADQIDYSEPFPPTLVPRAPCDLPPATHTPGWPEVAEFPEILVPETVRPEHDAPASFADHSDAPAPPASAPIESAQARPQAASPDATSLDPPTATTAAIVSRPDNAPEAASAVGATTSVTISRPSPARPPGVPPGSSSVSVPSPGIETSPGSQRPPHLRRLATLDLIEPETSDGPPIGPVPDAASIRYSARVASRPAG